MHCAYADPDFNELWFCSQQSKINDLWMKNNQAASRDLDLTNPNARLDSNLLIRRGCYKPRFSLYNFQSSAPEFKRYTRATKALAAARWFYDVAGKNRGYRNGCGLSDAELAWLDAIPLPPTPVFRHSPVVRRRRPRRTNFDEIVARHANINIPPEPNDVLNIVIDDDDLDLDVDTIERLLMDD